MAQSDILPVNFTISPAAKQAIAQVRREYDAEFADDPAAVLCVAWGFYKPQAGPQFENVMITFYPRSMAQEVAHGIQEASGLPLVFFVTEEFHSRFAEKILDHTTKRGFFLRR